MLKLGGAVVKSTARKWPPAKPWNTQKLGYAYRKVRRLCSIHFLEPALPFFEPCNRCKLSPWAFLWVVVCVLTPACSTLALTNIHILKPDLMYQVLHEANCSTRTTSTRSLDLSFMTQAGHSRTSIGTVCCFNAVQHMRMSTLNPYE